MPFCALRLVGGCVGITGSKRHKYFRKHVSVLQRVINSYWVETTSLSVIILRSLVARKREEKRYHKQASKHPAWYSRYHLTFWNYTDIHFCNKEKTMSFPIHVIILIFFFLFFFMGNWLFKNIATYNITHLNQLQNLIIWNEPKSYETNPVYLPKQTSSSGTPLGKKRR